MERKVRSGEVGNGRVGKGTPVEIPPPLIFPYPHPCFPTLPPFLSLLGKFDGEGTCQGCLGGGFGEEGKGGMKHFNGGGEKWGGRRGRKQEGV